MVVVSGSTARRFKFFPLNPQTRTIVPEGHHDAPSRDKAVPLPHLRQVVHAAERSDAA